MRVLVLGAGVVGMTTAYYLHRAGHEVTVVEQHAGVAEEASKANAGGLCPGFSGPWASPGILKKLPRWLLQANAPLKIGAGIRLADVPWLLKFTGNCTAAAFARNKARMQRVAHYSRSCFKTLNDELGWGENYDFRPTGVLQLFRDAQEVKNAAKGAVRVLIKNGTAHQLVDADGIVALDPALAASAHHFSGGLFLPTDAAGDSHKFAQEMAAWLVAHGVSIRYHCAVHSLELAAGEVIGVHTSQGRLTADAYVSALGNYAASLLRPLGLKLPIRPVKGYSLTARIRPDAEHIPAVTIMDECHKTMVSRLGDRIRIAGMAEINGFDTRLPAAQADFLRRQLNEIYPGLIAPSSMEFWSGLRPMTADGPPILGKTPIGRLYLNAGHGSSGWTQSCGTGKLVADIVSGICPEIDLEGLTLERFSPPTEQHAQ